MTLVRNAATEKAQQVKLLRTLEEIVKPKVKDALSQVAEAAALEYLRTGTPTSDRVILENIFRVDAVLRKHYKMVINLFAVRNVQALNNQKAKPKIKGPYKLPSRFDFLVSEYIDARALEQARLIGSTTQSDLREIIKAGVDDGLSNAQIAKNIRERGGQEIAKVRADSIAITETHNAAMFGNFESADSLNQEYKLELKKQWIAVEDNRTRPEHAAADGQVVDMGDKFDVGGEPMDYPGDPSASPENVIRCRCVIGYVTQ